MSVIIPELATGKFEYIHDGFSYFVNKANEEQKNKIDATYFTPSTLIMLEVESYVVTDEEGLEHGYVVAFEDEGYVFVSKFGNNKIHEGVSSIIDTLNQTHKIDISKKKTGQQVGAILSEEFDSMYT